MGRIRGLLLVVAALVISTLACVRQPAGPVMIITATPPDEPLGIRTLVPDAVVLPGEPTMPTTAPGALIVPTLDPPRTSTLEPVPDAYVVRAGDTLSAIGERFGSTVDRLMALNNIDNPSLIAVGQVIQLPDVVAAYSPAFKIIPDSELVFGPGAADFDLHAYIASLPGYIHEYRGTIEDDTLDAAEIVRRVAVDFSVNPRLLLALLEYRSGWLFDPTPSEATLLYPMGYQQLGYEGLHKQLEWAANRLNEAYYGWRARGQVYFTFPDGVRVTYAPGINAGTVAVQFFLSLNQEYAAWLNSVEAGGFYALYVSLFGDPFLRTVEPLLPPGLTQPALNLPFAPGELWYYTGGPHGAYAAGSAWAAVDFAPPGDEDTAGCFVAPQWATAVADGIIARSERGFAVLDLDGDGDETTGWNIVYLHLATEGRMPAGIQVKAGDPVGKPSCEGGVSYATHLHIGRKYNGEWIPVTCHACAPGVPDVPFVMGGWTFVGWEGQEYQGAMVRGEEYRQAEQGRDTPINQVQW